MGNRVPAGSGEALIFDDPRTGLALALAHLSAVGAALMLLVIWIGTGAMIRRLASRDQVIDVPARWLVDASLGVGALATVLLGLGAVGVLRPAIVLGMTLLGAVIARHEIAAAVRDAASAAARLFGDRATAGGAAMVSVLLLLSLVAAVAPPTEWDSLMYHLRIPLDVLETGRIGLPRDSFHVALVGASHLATLPLLAAGILVGPAVMQVFAFALVIVGTYALARAAQCDAASRWIAVAAVVGCPIVMLGAVTARVDVALMLPLVGAHLVLTEAASGRPRLLLLGGLLVGIALAIKPLAGAYAIALAPVAWRAVRTDARRWQLTAGTAMLAAAVALPWCVKNLLLVGAPLYPIGAPGWFEPWLAAIYGTNAIPASVDRSILRALPESRAGFDIVGAFLSPELLTIEDEGRYYALSPALLLVPLVALRWRSQRIAIECALVGLAYAALVIVPFGQINLRYLMPALPALAVGSAAAIEGLLARLGNSRRLVAVVAALILSLLPLARPLGVWFGGDMTVVKHALGLVPAREVWTHHHDQGVRDYVPVIENVRRLVPADGLVLMFWEARALPLQRPAIADIMLSNWSYLAQSPAVSRCLSGTGITHILVNRRALEYYIARGARPESFRLEELRRFLPGCAAASAGVGPGFVLVALKSSG